MSEVTFKENLATLGEIKRALAAVEAAHSGLLAAIKKPSSPFSEVQHSMKVYDSSLQDLMELFDPDHPKLYRASDIVDPIDEEYEARAEESEDEEGEDYE